MSKMFQISKEHCSEDRSADNLISHSDLISRMRLLLKDHKPMKEDSPFPSRPVVSGNAAMNTALSEILSMTLEPIADFQESAEILCGNQMLEQIDNINDGKKNSEIEINRTHSIDPSLSLSNLQTRPRKEDISRAEIMKTMKNKINLSLRPRYNGKPIDQQDYPFAVQEKEGKTVIIGSDVVSLYPNLVDTTSALLCYHAVKESPVKFENINYRACGKFLAAFHKEDPGINDDLDTKRIKWLLPTKNNKNKRMPGLSNENKNENNNNIKEKDRWDYSRLDRMTEYDKTLILSSVIRMLVIIAFNSHCYRFGGKIYMQNGGGPIGLRCTAAISRVVMNTHDNLVFRALNRCKIETLLMCRYVDDGRMILKPIKKGWRWTGQSFEYSLDWETEDQDEDPITRTSREILKVQNSQIQMLKFTPETELEFEDQRLPTLDFSLKIEEDGKISYLYFEKAMSANTVMHRHSALPNQTKKSTIVAETVRRMNNTSTNCSAEERRNVIENWMKKLANSGFEKELALPEIKRGILRFMHRLKISRLKQDNPKYKGLHDWSKGSLLNNRKAKLVNKETWYRPQRKADEALEANRILKNFEEQRVDLRKHQKDDQEMNQKDEQDPYTTTLLFVPSTKDGRLTEMVREAENELAEYTGFKMKHVEKSGTKIQFMFPTEDLKRTPCMRQNCPICKYPEHLWENCFAHNIVYTATCSVCNPEILEPPGKNKGKGPSSQKKQMKGLYIGETARSLCERANEHLDKARNISEDSMIVRHWLQEHAGDENMPQFFFKVISRHTSPLSRQVEEAILISTSEAELINNKEEMIHNSLPRLSFEGMREKCSEVDWRERIKLAKDRLKKRAFQQTSEGGDKTIGEGEHGDQGTKNKRRRQNPSNKDLSSITEEEKKYPDQNCKMPDNETQLSTDNYDTNMTSTTTVDKKSNHEVTVGTRLQGEGLQESPRNVDTLKRKETKHSKNVEYDKTKILNSKTTPKDTNRDKIIRTKDHNQYNLIKKPSSAKILKSTEYNIHNIDDIPNLYRKPPKDPDRDKVIKNPNHRKYEENIPEYGLKHLAKTDSRGQSTGLNTSKITDFFSRNY